MLLCNLSIFAVWYFMFNTGLEGGTVSLTGYTLYKYIWNVENKKAVYFPADFNFWLTMLFVSEVVIVHILLLKPEYSAITRPISWLLMPLLRSSFGHQWPPLWLLRLNGRLTSKSTSNLDFKYLHKALWKSDRIRKCIFMLPEINSRQHGLRYSI